MLQHRFQRFNKAKLSSSKLLWPPLAQSRLPCVALQDCGTSAPLLGPISWASMIEVMTNVVSQELDVHGKGRWRNRQALAVTGSLVHQVVQPVHKCAKRGLGLRGTEHGLESPCGLVG